MSTELFALRTSLPALISSKASNTNRLNVSPEARRNEILCKPMEEQNPRLTTDSSPVYPRFISRTRSALSFWLLTSGPKPFRLCKHFSCACPRTCSCQVQNSDISRAGRGGAAHGRAEKDVDGPDRPGDICLSCPPGYRRQLF